MSARTFYTLSGVGISLLLLLLLRSLYSPNPSAPNAVPNAPFADATQQQKAESAKKAWDAYTLTPDGKTAESARKKTEKEAAEHNSPAGKAKAEAGQIRRYLYSRKCEEVLLDLGYDIKCLPDENSNTLMVVGKPVNRVFVHQMMSRVFDAKTLKILGFKTLKFWNESTFSSYSETYDVSR